MRGIGIAELLWYVSGLRQHVNTCNWLRVLLWPYPAGGIKPRTIGFSYIGRYAAAIYSPARKLTTVVPSQQVQPTPAISQYRTERVPSFLRVSRRKDFSSLGGSVDWCRGVTRAISSLCFRPRSAVMFGLSFGTWMVAAGVDTHRRVVVGVLLG